MKKVFFFIVAFLFAFNVKAQDKPTSGDGVSFGVKVGINFASVSGDDVDNFDGRTGINIGGVVNIPVSEKFSVQPELVYSSQGFTGEESGIDYTGKLDYINVPILADFKFGDGFSLQAGPQIGFNITDKIEAEGESESIDAESIDFGGVLGAQYRMKTGLFFQARYALGFSDIVEDADAKNGVLSISVGYFF